MKGNLTHSAQDIAALLPLLDEQTADSLESESLDFKECGNEKKLRELAQKMAVCFANTMGGTVVFGVCNSVVGRGRAVVGIDFAPDLDAIRAGLYDSIDPKLPVQFEWILDGARRLLLMHVQSINPPYTTTDGRGWMRIGKECKPLTGSLRHQVHERAGLADPTREFVPVSDPIAGISPAALELLRREMREAGVPEDQITRPDRELCTKLGMIRDGRLTLGGLLVVGREELLAEHAPNHEWKYSRMRSDVELDTLPVTGRESLLIALDKLKLVLAQQNPITTLESDFFHTEFPRYPVLALREALLNAFVHRDYTIPGMVFIRHWNDRVEINSPGSFVGGVTPNNILHHPPVTRNRYLVETILTATRLVNRQNMGVPRIFRSLLEEGKEPPRFDEVGQAVRLTFPGQEVDQAFRRLIRFLVESQGAHLDADTLLLLHFFRRRQEAELAEIREAYPYNDRQLIEKLAVLEHTLLAIEHSGSGDNRVFRLSRRTATILAQGTTDELTRRIDREAMKSRIVSLLRDRPLRNKDVRAFTDLTRKQVTALLSELEGEGYIRREGWGAGTLWHIRHRPGNGQMDAFSG